VTRSRDLLTLDEARQLAAISPKQAGHLLSMGKNATYQAIQRGQIPSLRIGSKIVIPTESLLRLLAGDRP